MAALQCYRRLNNCLQTRCLTIDLIRSQETFLSTKSIFPTSNPPPLLSCLKTRTFCSHKGQNDNDEINAPSVTITQGPFGWLSKTVNLWFLKTFIDREFDEREFLRGARQALCTVSDQLAKGNVDEMQEVFSEKLANDIRNRLQTYKADSVVRMEDILSANIQKVQLGIVENGRGKVLLIQVAFVCKATGNENRLFEKQMGNVKIIGIPVPKVTYYTFRKFIFPDSVGTWHVEYITSNK